MRRLSIAAAAALTLLTGCATATPQEEAASRQKARAELASLIGDRVETGTQQCVDPQMIEGPTIIDTHTIVYRLGGRYYRNDLVGPCPSLRPTSTLITDIKTGNLCRNDMFRVLNAGETIPSAYCRLGNFTVYAPRK